MHGASGSWLRPPRGTLEPWILPNLFGDTSSHSASGDGVYVFALVQARSGEQRSVKLVFTQSAASFALACPKGRKNCVGTQCAQLLSTLLHESRATPAACLPLDGRAAASGARIMGCDSRGRASNRRDEVVSSRDGLVRRGASEILCRFDNPEDEQASHLVKTVGDASLTAVRGNVARFMSELKLCFAQPHT